ncbi:hypothetical protein ARALYDRAFT_904267 [Arabidopsis lyrata subsp. lyrata]|uniref:Secreted protein n=1 Tax=Arabidopsis lyrata subsp. lyrata TaxID=81972 RepID=D7LHD6_ARALL|nr:hypothetical protein ARALYDRAFT_904267 [Arabidopsis lyrata subsp. lyrata]
MLLGLVMLGRANSVFSLSALSNLTKKITSREDQLQKTDTVGWWVRGAVSIALAYNKFKRSGHS